MIQGIQLKKINSNFDDRGFLIEVLKENDEFFKTIKQTNYTETYPGVIKAFHWHEKQWDFWFFNKGAAQVVLHDLREGSPTQNETNVFYLGEQNFSVLIIPPGVAHGYRVLGNDKTGLFYHTTEVYDPKNPDEKRIPYNDPKIGFDWQTKNR